MKVPRHHVGATYLRIARWTDEAWERMMEKKALAAAEAEEERRAQETRHGLVTSGQDVSRV